MTKSQYMKNYKLFIVVFLAVFAGSFAGPRIAEAISISSQTEIGLLSGLLSLTVVAGLYLLDRWYKKVAE